MAIRSGFFNGVNDDRLYDASRFAEYFATFIGNGVFPQPGDGLQVMSNNDMTISIRPGKGWINGYIVINDTDYIIAIDPADGVLRRIDRIVLRWDIEDREIRIEVKKGAFASSPVVQPLQRDADAYELVLADIVVNKGAISISQANITDLRMNSELCGIVHALIDQVDFTTLFNQYQDWIDQKKAEYNTDLIDYKTAKYIEIQGILDGLHSDFINWFNTIVDILDTNAAGNLLLEIEKVREEVNNRNLPLAVIKYNEVSQWSDILIPDESRGKALLEFLLLYGESSLQVTSSEQAMLVIMEEDRFNKNRQVPFDYDQIIFKLGQKTETGQYLAWVEELLADHTRGIEKLELGLMLESGSNEIASNKYAMNVIMQGEQVEGLNNYRRKLADKENVDNEISRLDTRIDGVVV